MYRLDWLLAGSFILAQLRLEVGGGGTVDINAQNSINIDGPIMGFSTPVNIVAQTGDIIMSTNASINSSQVNLRAGRNINTRNVEATTDDFDDVLKVTAGNGVSIGGFLMHAFGDVEVSAQNGDITMQGGLHYVGTLDKVGRKRDY